MRAGLRRAFPYSVTRGNVFSWIVAEDLRDKGSQVTIRSEARKAFDLAAVCWETLVARRRATNGHADLVILDDAFPHLLSAFRIAEFNAYLDRFPRSEVHSSGGCFKEMGECRSFEAVRRDYAAVYPHLGDRVVKYHGMRRIEGRFGYAVFLSNVRYFLPVLRRNGIRFVFTLYPGGGFRLEQRESDDGLRRVFDDRGFGKVLVTQKITRDYLLDGRFVDPERVEFVYGAVLPAAALRGKELPKCRFREDKETFDICFVAFKYMRQGRDKGYDLFVETARRLARRSGHFRFHVVGPFDPTDVDVTELDGRILFHGRRATDFFPPFYAGMDIILSPNVPFVLHPGAFDGFPTAACAEAGLCGVAVFCSDVLCQNVRFRDREEIVIVPPDPGDIEETIWQYYSDPDALYRLSELGRNAFREAFDLSRQMEPRFRCLSECMAG